MIVFFLKLYLKYCNSLEKGFLKNMKGETDKPLSFQAL